MYRGCGEIIFDDKKNNQSYSKEFKEKIVKEYLIKGYAINEERSLVTNENYVRLINKVESLDERISNIENKYKPQEFKSSQLFFDEEFYDAYTLIQSLIESANNEIIIIDNNRNKFLCR
mgnify:CR=1 FL=1